MHGMYVILHADDSKWQRQALRDALKETEDGCWSLYQVTDGEQALRFVQEPNGGSAKLRPDLILLDLDMPKRHGFEVLAELKRRPEYRMIPVVILTSSEGPLERWTAYDLGANGYVVKPVDPDELQAKIVAVCRYWLSVNAPPPRDI